MVDARSLLTIGFVDCEANRAGYRRVLGAVRRQAPGRRVFALAGGGSYGAGLRRRLEAAGERVLEVERPRREGSRGRLKSDPLDAERAARSLLAGQAGGEPRRGEEREAAAGAAGRPPRRRAGGDRGRQRAARAGRDRPAELRERLQRRSQTKLVLACTALQPGRHRDPARAGLALALRSLAERVQALRAEANTLTNELARRTQRLAPKLRAEQGVGPVTAAVILVSWSHPGRLKGEAAFARLAGVAPIPASSRRRSATGSTAVATAD
jgi:transposase